MGSCVCGGGGVSSRSTAAMGSVVRLWQAAHRDKHIAPIAGSPGSGADRGPAAPTLSPAFYEHAGTRHTAIAQPSDQVVHKQDLQPHRSPRRPLASDGTTRRLPAQPRPCKSPSPSRPASVASTLKAPGPSPIDRPCAEGLQRPFVSLPGQLTATCLRGDGVPALQSTTRPPATYCEGQSREQRESPDRRPGGPAPEARRPQRLPSVEGSGAGHQHRNVTCAWPTLPFPAGQRSTHAS